MDWLWAGGIVAAISAAWGYISRMWTLLSSLVIVQVIVQDSIVDAVLTYLQDTFKQGGVGPQNYMGSWVFVRPVSRVRLVAWKVLGKLGSFYVKKRRFLWVTCGKEGEETDSRDRTMLSPYSLRICFIRGQFRADAFVQAAVDYFNKVRDDVESKSSKRHCIRRIYGLSKKRMFVKENDVVETKSLGGDTSSDYLQYRNAHPLGYTQDDIGVTIDHSLDSLALSNSAEESILEARRWKSSESWYKDHKLPWKRGWLLYGLPGNGKTALARALAEELDLPVYIYDLASLANDEFQSHWGRMLSSVPCIALIEDIDSVFDGRRTVVGDLTFDCLLNCLDGIERSDGLFIIITTNNPDRVDPALGIADEMGRSTRPGRVDRAILMSSPDVGGRLKIAKRILAEHPEHWQSVVDEGSRETGAQFQERCATLALQLYWKDSYPAKGNF